MHGIDMNRIIFIALLTSGFALADSWSGQLIDAKCKQEAYQSDSHSATGCAPTTLTAVFAIQTPDGKVYKLDDVGNRKAATIVKDHPLRADDTLGLTVTVSGSLDGEMMKVDSLDLNDRPQ
jgi:hypothetical protein